MKYLKLSLLIVLVMVVCARFSYTTIVGSAHDLKAKSYTDEVCNVCHTPHNANTTVSDAPLWDHTLATTSYGLYSSSTLDASMGQPDGTSKLCLSCHDGSVAVDNFGSSLGGADANDIISGDALIGTTLADDHPVSFIYNAGLATSDGELTDPTTANSDYEGTGTIEGTMLFGTAGSKTMECATCHDVHDPTNIPFLRASNTASAMCLTCHIK